jgi:hypothetical protein
MTYNVQTICGHADAIWSDLRGLASDESPYQRPGSLRLCLNGRNRRFASSATGLSAGVRRKSRYRPHFGQPVGCILGASSTFVGTLSLTIRDGTQVIQFAPLPSDHRTLLQSQLRDLSAFGWRQVSVVRGKAHARAVSLCRRSSA